MARKLVGLLCFMAAATLSTSALADVAGPSPSEGPDGRCRPGQQEGESCTTYDDEEGTCTDERVDCYDYTTNTATTCAVCEENGCSIGAVGSRSGSRQAWVGLGALALAAGLGLGLRTRTRRRGPR